MPNDLIDQVQECVQRFILDVPASNEARAVYEKAFTKFLGNNPEIIGVMNTFYMEFDEDTQLYALRTNYRDPLTERSRNDFAQFVHTRVPLPERYPHATLESILPHFVENEPLKDWWQFRLLIELIQTFYEAGWTNFNADYARDAEHRIVSLANANKSWTVMIATMRENIQADWEFSRIMAENKELRRRAEKHHLSPEQLEAYKKPDES